MLKNSKILILILTALITLSVGSFAFAQDNLGLNQAANIGLSTPAESDLRMVLVNIIRYLLGFVGIIAVAVVLYAGFLWMTSTGRPDQLIKAKKMLTGGMVGLIIILSAFAIVTFIVNLFEGGGGLGRSGRPDGPGYGIGALGACAIESVYPAPGQVDVPRNTSIIVTFKKDVDADTICDDDNDNDLCDNNESIIPENIHIYQSAQGNSCQWATDHYENCVGTNVGNVNVTQTGANDRTFVFDPIPLLGNPTSNTKYSVRLDEAITDTDGNSIFDDCKNIDSMIWSFDVSNRLDLVPPQVKENGVIPVPDSTKDQRVESVAVAAVGRITVSELPQAEIVAAAVYDSGSGVAAVDGLVIDPNNSEEGLVDVNLPGGGDGVTAQLSRKGTSILLGSATFNGQTVVFPGYFTLTAENDVAAGNLWTINLTARKTSDTLTVGSVTYHFVPAGTTVEADDGLINTNTDINTVASNIYNKINGDIQVVGATNPGAPSPIIDLKANSLGVAGNSIQLWTNNSDLFTFDPMHDGADSEITMVTESGGIKDEPRNVTIRIDFNEAISPVSVSGDSTDVSDVIQVRCLSGSCTEGIFVCGANTCVNGHFEVSNQYQTIDFTSEIECGVNSCGEKIYCLPSNSHLEVWMQAASLEDCVDNGNCLSKQDFNTCSNLGATAIGNHCNNGTNYYSYSVDMDGIMDTANNSLDGNRNNYADGQVSDYEQNPPEVVADGDNYKWNFWVSDLIDTVPPIINDISPGINDSDAELDVPIEVEFSKPMLSSSLKTGQSKSRVGEDLITHRHINLWAYNNRATGYWVTNKINLDENDYPDTTTVYINHSLFGPLLTYRTQIGSGVLDIYQNCFRPAEDARAEADECTGDDFNSCCDGEEDITDRCDD
ncbi:MAG: Ig-like domain-containing protein [Patescibacteria group bacterium]|nr:Ig-like domain-containing protein [Patescibacteria group bacterium]